MKHFDWSSLQRARVTAAMTSDRTRGRHGDDVIIEVSAGEATQRRHPFRPPAQAQR